MSAFDDALTHVGRVVIPQSTYDAFRARDGKPKRDVSQIESDEERRILQRDYWLAAKCDELPPKLAGIVFATACRYDVKRARRYLMASGWLTLKLTEDAAYAHIAGLLWQGGK